MEKKNLHSIAVIALTAAAFALAIPGNAQGRRPGGGGPGGSRPSSSQSSSPRSSSSSMSSSPRSSSPSMSSSPRSSAPRSSSPSMSSSPRSSSHSISSSSPRTSSRARWRTRRSTVHQGVRDAQETLTGCLADEFFCDNHQSSPFGKQVYMAQDKQGVSRTIGQFVFFNGRKHVVEEGLIGQRLRNSILSRANVKHFFLWYGN